MGSSRNKIIRRIYVIFIGLETFNGSRGNMEVNKVIDRPTKE